MMIQAQSCEFSPYYKTLSCTCDRLSSKHSLNLRLEFFMKEMMQEISMVNVSSCQDLVVSLDVVGVNPTNININFKNSQKIRIDQILFDSRYADNQKLSINFYNVDTFSFIGLDVKEAIEVTADNVKEAKFIKSSFSHIPMNGISVSQAKSLEIRDCVFMRIQPRSVVAKNTKDVTIMNNQFNINAIKVVSAREGAHLYISCNRLLGESISPECVTRESPSRTTMSTTTTTEATTTTSSTTIIIQEKEVANQSTDNSNTMVYVGIAAGVVGFLILILIIVLLWLYCRRRTGTKTETVEVAVVDEEVTKEETIEAEPETMPVLADPGELEALLGEEPEVRAESPKPRFKGPVWLEEINKNKLFNKQKSIMEEMGEVGKQPVEDYQVNLENEERPVPVPEEETVTDIGQEDVKESSRTESDEDFHMEEEKKKEPLDEELDELQSLLKKAYEQEQALRNSD